MKHHLSVKCSSQGSAVSLQLIILLAAGHVLDHARDLGGTATASTGTATILKDTC